MRNYTSFTFPFTLSFEESLAYTRGIINNSIIFKHAPLIFDAFIKVSRYKLIIRQIRTTNPYKS